ncbi:MAG: hypothetical protein LJE58_13755, partial [Thiogranum sp.]|nr:hypothetical protein [Thiogranum sp.]
VEHGMILAKNGRVNAGALPFDIRHYHKHNNHAAVRSQQAAAGSPAATETDPHKREILDALEDSGGNRAEAARKLGIDRSTLWRRMHRLNLI